MTDRDRLIANDAGAVLNRADHRARILPRAFETHQRRADADHVSRGGEQPLDPARLRRRDFDDGFSGFDRDQRLIDVDVLAGGHAPFYELGLLQPFSEIGETKDIHDASITCRTPSIMRSTLGIYCLSNFASGTTTS